MSNLVNNELITDLSIRRAVKSTRRKLMTHCTESYYDMRLVTIHSFCSCETVSLIMSQKR